MKTKKMLLSAAIALSTALTPVVAFTQTAPVMAETVNNTTNHAYKAYQIFSGSQSSDGALGNIEWGTGVDGDALLTDLQTKNSEAFGACLSAADVAKVVANYGEDSTEARAFARIVADHVSEMATEIAATDTSKELAPGYYLLVDQNVDKDHGLEDNGVVGLSLLQLTKKGNVNITSKTNKPSVEKKVSDEKDENRAPSVPSDPNAPDPFDGENDYKDSADHEIGETFRFKLTATIPTDDNMKEYETYKVVFHDTLSKGLTKGDIVSVKVNDTTLTAEQYTATESIDTKTKETTFTLTIEDIVRHLGTGNTLSGSTVEVIYEATLNGEAVVSHSSFEQKNTVYLEYSNNPNNSQDGTSNTPEDNVFVGTFELPNIKKDGTTENHPALQDAGFKLKNNATEKWAIFDANGKLTGWADKEAEGSEYTTGEDGKFKFSGLDAGTYTLKETTTPAGFNTAANITVVIEATHADTASTKEDVKPVVTVKHNNILVTGEAEILNYKGSTLPETGGMGTTVIYTIGGLLTVSAAVVYVTNKRSRKE